MDLYNLSIKLPVDEKVDEVLFKYLSNKKYKHKHWQNPVIPHQREIFFEDLDMGSINLIKDQFRNMYSSSIYKNYCSFQILGKNEFN